jgi:hypothetical protein
MEKRFILRGILAGAVGGVLAFVFARIFAEPLIEKAVNYESGRDAAQTALDKAAGLPTEPADPDIFSRTIQANVGSGIGILLFAMAMGALFAVTYAIYLGRVGNLRPRALALLVAGGGFLGFYLVPFIKYPANPPSIGHAETIRERSGLYLVMVFASIAFLVLAAWLGQKLKPRFGNWTASLLAGGAFVVAIGVLMAILPAVRETPQPLTDPSGTIVYPGFPADTLYGFRFYSVAAQLILWATIGLVFAPLADRLLRPPAAANRPDRAAVTI